MFKARKINNLFFKEAFFKIEKQHKKEKLYTIVFSSLISYFIIKTIIISKFNAHY